MSRGKRLTGMLCCQVEFSFVKMTQSTVKMYLTQGSVGTKQPYQCEVSAEDRNRVYSLDTV